MDLTETEEKANLQVPVDLFVSIKHRGLFGSVNLEFTNASGNLVFKIDPQLHKSNLPYHKRFLVDASGNPLISIHRITQNGSWEGFKQHNGQEGELLFGAKRTLNTFSRTEYEVFLVGDHGENSGSDTIKMKGSPFNRSCTMFRGNSILAQTSLMHKLGLRKVFVSRCRFRLTIFPGFVDYAFIVALVVIFFDGQKLWI